MIVDELKKSILKYAIEGKLTKSLSDDSNVHQQFEKYIEELSDTNNFIKVNKSLKPISEEPFNLKDNWCWLRLGNIIRIHSGDGLVSKNMIDEGIPVYGGNGITGYHNKNNIDKKTIVIGRVGFYCGSVHLTEDKCWVTDNAFIVDYPKNYFDINYLTYLLKYLDLGKNNSSTAQPVISGSKIYNILCPIAPIEEQYRIVKKIEEFYQLLGEIKPLEEQLDILKKSFPNVLKKSIFMAALKGDLSSNNILEKINEDETPSSSLLNKPFDIPKNWVWFGHNDLFEIIGGSQPPKNKFSEICKEGYIQLYQTRDYGPNPQPVYVDKKDVSKFSKKGDILLARYGGSLGKVFWAEDGAYNVALAKVIIKYPNIINKKYLYYYYLADLYQSKVKNGNRSAQAGFSKDDLNNLAFPLPPIEEQQRIVDKIEKLLPLVDDINNLVGE